MLNETAVSTCMICFAHACSRIRICIKVKDRIQNSALSPMKKITGRYNLRVRRELPSRTLGCSTEISLSVPNAEGASYSEEANSVPSVLDDIDYSPSTILTSDSECDGTPPPERKVKRQRRNNDEPSAKRRGAYSSNTELPKTFTGSEIALLREKLLEWYAQNYRRLPWRKAPQHGKIVKPNELSTERDSCQSSPGAPYAVWISEIMSQQTRISVASEYWRRWMSEFPTIESLGNAPLERVNELWSGLGYYRRARFVHEAAVQLVKEYNGKLPGSKGELMKIKGIGSYTAGAIASIAFNEAVPAVDGNVERVLARLRPAILPNTEPNASKTVKTRAYMDLANHIVQDIECAGDFNQAMMELGATVCTPKQPKCTSCPVQALCGAYMTAKLQKANPASYVERYPAKDVSRRVKVRDESVLVCVVSRRNSSSGKHEYLLLQRPDDGLLAGLWECPSVVLPVTAAAQGGELTRDLREQHEIAMRTLLTRLDVHEKIANRKAVGNTKHIFSHIRQCLHVESAHIGADTCSTEGTCSAGRFQWVARDDLEKRAIATQMRKAIKLALAE